MGEQLELFTDEPFCLRITIEDAVRIFWDNYWCHLPFGKKSQAILRRTKDFFKGHYLDSISKADVERFRRHLIETGLSISTVNKHHMVLSRIFSKFEEYKEGRFVNGTDFSRITLPNKNPAAQVPKVSEEDNARRFEITPERKHLLCQFADEDLAEIIDVLYWSGLRQGDLFAITEKNLETTQCVFFGTQNKHVTTRKPSGTPYRVPIPESRRKMVLRRLKEAAGGPLFKDTNLQKRWGRARKLAGMVDPYINNVQMRDLRGGAIVGSSMKTPIFKL